MKSILDQLVGTSEPVTRFNNLTIDKLKEMVAQIQQPKESEDDPYAILMNQVFFYKLVKQKYLNTHYWLCPKEKVVPIFLGFPVIFDNDITEEYKILTRKEYKEYYEKLKNNETS